MLILVSGPGHTYQPFLDSPRFGHLRSPRNMTSIAKITATGKPWACDNFAYAAWCPVRFRRMIAQVTAPEVDRSRLLWVACPDVVADARTTMERFDEWEPWLASQGLPVALVGQDGVEDLDVPWDRCAALFVGGSTKWKLSEAAEVLVLEAKVRQKWVHMGRVNSNRRIRHAYEIGCDSIDGTSFSLWRDRYFPMTLKYLARLEQQPTFFGVPR